MSNVFKRCSSAAHVPKRAHKNYAWYDVWFAEKVILKPCNQEFVLIDLKVAIPEGYYGRVVRRSGIAKKYGIIVHNATIDLDYHGIVGVIFFNFSKIRMGLVLQVLDSFLALFKNLSKNNRIEIT